MNIPNVQNGYEYGGSDIEESDSFTDTESDSVELDETEPPWKGEVSKDGELFYVEEEPDENFKMATANRKFSDDQNLHGTSQEPRTTHSMDPARANGRFIPIEKQASEARSVTSEPVTEKISNKEAYREYRQKLQRDEQQKKEDSFQLHSEQVVADLKNVSISVRAASAYGRKGSSSLLSSMLGIISINSRNGGQYIYNSPQEDQVIVSALMPNGPASRSEAIFLGEILLAVNGVAVYQSNIEQVLSRVPEDMELTLTLQRQKPVIHFSSHDSINPSEREAFEDVGSNTNHNLVRLLKPSDMDTVVTSVGYYHAAFYLTLNVNSETARGEEDILYSYPSSDNPSTRKLKSVRGIFTTLADVSKDAFRSKVLSSTLTVDEELVHCAYCHQGTEVMVICVPGSTYPLTHLHKMVSSTVRLLTVMFGSLNKAFDPENVSRIGHLFYLLFTSNSWSGIRAPDPQDIIGPPLCGTRALSLDEELSTDVDSALAELEAADFDDGLHSRGMTRRLYSVLGSCLFYKGYLIASHLPDEDLKDISVFCQTYCLLGKLRVGQLVIWRQVFPWRRRTNKKQVDGYQETEGKYYILIVGLRYSLLCMLLEAGGCSVPSTGKACPDSIYVNRARATILQMEGMDVPGGIEELLSRPAEPALSSVDTVARKPPTTFFGGSTPNKPPSGSGQAKPDAVGSQGTIKMAFLTPTKKSKRSSSNSGGVPSVGTPDKAGTSPSLMRRIGSQKSLGSQGSADSAGSGNKRGKNMPSSFSTGDLRAALPVNTEIRRLTAGSENTLFHYIHLNSMSGILLTPSDQDLACLDGPFHRTIVENFRQSVLVLHERLVMARKKNPDKARYEEGILFHCQLSNILPEGNKKSSPFVQYWVVGRMLTGHTPHEFYACFQDSAQQDMLELAFRMGFGSLV